MKKLIIALICAATLLCTAVAAVDTHQDISITITDSDAALIARTIWGEARGCSDLQKQAVAWCILNRVDDARFPNSVAGVVKQRYQFAGYSSGNPIDEELYAIAVDVLARWQMEQYCIGDVGRVLPREFVYFGGNGTSNRFRDAYDTKKANYWEE